MVILKRKSFLDKRVLYDDLSLVTRDTVIKYIDILINCSYVTLRWSIVSEKYLDLCVLSVMDQEQEFLSDVKLNPVFVH